MTDYQPHRVIREDREDGVILLRSGYEMSQPARRTGDWLEHWADQAPERVFLGERSGAGWRQVTYAEALERVQAIAAGLVARGASAERPILILSGNSVDHGLLVLAAQMIGVPVVPVAEQYALVAAAHGQLRHVIATTHPAIAYAEDGKRFAAALSLPEIASLDRVVGKNPGQGMATLDALATDQADISVMAKAVGPDTVAKILMTSGSTSAPKGVENTQGMMTANQAQIGDAFPFLRTRPPVLVDWLPWNHTFGGSHNFNIVLANGGTLWIDDGKPVKGLVERTIENLKMKAGTAAFNVPVGFAAVRDALASDADFRRHYFADLDIIFYAGASLPQDVWRDLDAMARAERGAPILTTSSWGLTETAPAHVAQHQLADRSGVVGVPVTGAMVKLLPRDEGRYEIRVAGPNVFKCYHRDPEKTAAAFDEEGYFLTGDAMSFVDETDMNRGLRFVGRIGEDFKLVTGTWVRAARLRMELLSLLAPLAQDVVITGADRDKVGLLIFPNAGGLAASGFGDSETEGFLADPGLLKELSRRLATRGAHGSSGHVAHAAFLAEPPSMPDGEITAKGSINFAKVLSRRAALVDRLYAGGANVVS